MKKLRIASFVTGLFPTPPPSSVIYAQIVMATAIAEGIALRGHHVSYFAPQGSKASGNVHIVSGDLVPFHSRFPEEPLIFSESDVRSAEREKIVALWDQRLAAELYRMAERGAFDIIHSHTPDRVLPLGFIGNTPTVHTLHTPVMSWHKTVFGLFANSSQFFVSLSNAQRITAPHLPWAKTIYNGIDLNLFPFSDSPGGAFLFLGRLVAQKGVAEAVRAAQLAQAELEIVGHIQKDHPQHGRYWNEYVEPNLNERIRYMGSMPYEATYHAYQQAKALLAPIQWEEPFGLVFVEAMACGTPVIAFRRGSVPEIVIDGVTGFIVDTVEEMAEAMLKIDQIDRKACREHVERHFTLEKMVDQYEQLFLSLVK